MNRLIRGPRISTMGLPLPDEDVLLPSQVGGGDAGDYLSARLRRRAPEVQYGTKAQQDSWACID